MIGDSEERARRSAGERRRTKPISAFLGRNKASYLKTKPIWPGEADKSESRSRKSYGHLGKWCARHSLPGDRGPAPANKANLGKVGFDVSSCITGGYGIIIDDKKYLAQQNEVVAMKNSQWEEMLNKQKEKESKTE